MDLFSFMWGFFAAFIFSGLVLMLGFVIKGNDVKPRTTDTIRYPVTNRTPLGPTIEQFTQTVYDYFEIKEEDVQNIGIKPGKVKTLNMSLFLPVTVNYHDVIEPHQVSGQAAAKIKTPKRRKNG